MTQRFAAPAMVGIMAVKTRIPSKYLKDQEPLVGTGGSAQVVRHANRPGDACAETDTVISSRDIVIHGLGNADNLYAFLIEPYSIAERVVTPYGDQVVYSQKIQVFQHRRCKVIDIIIIFITQMIRHILFGYMTWSRSRGMQKGPACFDRLC